MFTRIRWRIAIPYVLLILAAMAGVGFYVSQYTRQTYLTNLSNEQLAEARLAAAALTPRLAGGRPDDLDQLTQDWAGILGARLTVMAPDGKVLADSQENWQTMENHANRPEVRLAVEQDTGSSTRFSTTIGYEMQYTAVRMDQAGETVGILRLALPLRQVQEQVAELQRTLLGATLLAGLLAALLALWIAAQTTHPLRLLTQAATQLSAGQLGNSQLASRIIPTSRDEIGQLTLAFNHMASQLEAQINVLESERARMAAVLDEMSDGVIMVDASGEIQLINPAACQIFALPADTPVSGSLATVLRNHQVVELWRSCQASNHAESATLELGTPAGPERLYLHSIATPLGPALPGHTLLLFQNLTQVRRLETVRRDFISNISHELRTPLASLKALTETLQDSALEDPPAARHFLQRMETEVDALSMMVTELLELARIESGRVPLQLAATDPCALLSESVARLQVQAERAGLALTIACPSPLPEVLADPKRMEQVLVNLLHNAIKFTPSGGTITLDAQVQGEYLRFSVQDSGVGIPAEDLPRIFERFFKADRARSGGGTGLGLAIANRLVEAHRGRIWAESRPGEGSTFYFTLPLV